MDNADQPDNHAPTSPTAADMEREIERLRQKTKELYDLQVTGRRQVIYGAVVIVLMFAVFMYETYARIQGNFSSDHVQAALNERAPQVVPLATRLVMESGRNAMPTYREEIAKTMRERGPELAIEAKKQLDKLPDQTGKLLEDRLNATFNKVIHQIEPRLQKDFPNMTEEERHLMIQAFVAQQIEAQNKQVADHINQLYTNDLIQMHQVLLKFKLPADANIDESELERKFLHTMVMLLDDQVDAAYAVPAEQPRLRKKTQTTQPSEQAANN